MPDFLFERSGVPFGWAEAKDIDKDVIRLKGYSVEQRKRYERAYPNLIYTNGVDFEFIREGESVHFVSIADFLMGLQPRPERFEELERQLRLFAEQKPISIRSAAKLAEMMAAKAAIIKDEIGIALAEMRHEGPLAWTTVTQAMMRATGAEDEAADEVVRLMQRVAGVRALALFKERYDGTTKISLRALPPINVATLAKTWGGGGHAQASGATLLMPPDQAADEVLPRLRALLEL